MFVPHEPYNCFDVYRTNDRCVCGCSAITTSHEGDDRGYCSRCSDKRQLFVNSLIGEIYLGDDNSINKSILTVLEQMRKAFFKERLFYMIDTFFADNKENKKFTEPYQDDIFIANAYSEKLLMMDTFINSLNFGPIVSNKSFFHKKGIIECLPDVYSHYKNELLEMKEIDIDELGYYNSKIGGYSYTKKFTPKITK